MVRNKTGKTSMPTHIVIIAIYESLGRIVLTPEMLHGAVRLTTAKTLPDSGCFLIYATKLAYIKDYLG